MAHIEPTPGDVAVLVGNGLSIAFNPELDLQSITEEVMRRITTAEGDGVIEAMRSIAERALPRGVTSGEDFEQLVGAFGTESRTLSAVEILAELAHPQNAHLHDAIRRVSRFLVHVQDSGVSHVLQVIAERSRASFEQSVDLHELITAITTEFPGRVTFGNLNYDTLLLAALMHAAPNDVADFGHGGQPIEVMIGSDRYENVYSLRRRASDFPKNKRVRLLHLHGSLTYWEDSERAVSGKLPRELLEGAQLWEAVRQGTTTIRPLVVLASADDKARHIEQAPYRLAYELFRHDLVRADKWLIIGYSFRDEPVNQVLRDALARRSGPPSILVVTRSENPRRRTIESRLGLPRTGGGDPYPWLRVSREGANGLQNTNDWAQFVGEPGLAP